MRLVKPRPSPAGFTSGSVFQFRNRPPENGSKDKRSTSLEGPKDPKEYKLTDPTAATDASERVQKYILR